MWRGGGQPTAAPILGARCRSAAAGVPMSGCAAGADPSAAQAVSVVAAAARAAAERHGDVAPLAAVPTAELAGSASAAAAATTAAAGCQAASRGAVPGGGPPPVAERGGDVASAPPPQHPMAPGPWRRGQWCAAPRRPSGVEQPMSATPRHAPPTNKGSHAVAVGDGGFQAGGDRGGRRRYLPGHRPPRRALRRAAKRR